MNRNIPTPEHTERLKEKQATSNECSNRVAIVGLISKYICSRVQGKVDFSKIQVVVENICRILSQSWLTANNL